MKIKPSILLGAVSCTLVLAACGTSGDNESSGPRVVAAFYPVAYVAEQVGGDVVDVENLTTPGGEPHDLELKPKQVGAVQEADLVVYIDNFQPAVDSAVDQAGRDDANLIDAASVSSSVEPSEKEGHSEEEEHAHEDSDPHIWLDPANMVAVTEAMSDKLSALDPGNASTYEDNAARFISELNGLDERFAAGLANCESDEIVVSHAAFSYLADAYGLKQTPIAGVDPSNEPSPATMADISSHVEDEGITTVFTETLASPAVAKTVAAETGTSLATLDPLEGLSDEAADETYLTIMDQNLAAIAKANRCT